MFIYVMGRPHSGSTILDILLGNSGAIESIGELVSGLAQETASASCACGMTMADCPYWERVRVTFTQASSHSPNASMSWDGLREKSVAQAHISNLPRTLAAGRRSPEFCRLGAATAALGCAIAAASGKAHALDSSKETTRALMLLRFCSDARVIHLVRNPRRTVASHYERFQQKEGYFKFLRRDYHAPNLLVPFMLVAAASWTIGNLICELARRIAPKRTIRIRYEDVCEQPTVEVRRIAEAFAIPLDDLIDVLDRRDDLVIGHNVGGNRIRHSGTIAFNSNAGNGYGLPRWLDVATVALCWPLMLLYGYPLYSSTLSRPIGQSR